MANYVRSIGLGRLAKFEWFTLQGGTTRRLTRRCTDLVLRLATPALGPAQVPVILDVIRHL